MSSIRYTAAYHVGGLTFYDVTEGEISVDGVGKFLEDRTADEEFKMSEMYRGGTLVPDESDNSEVPTSGQIKLTNMYEVGVYR